MNANWPTDAQLSQAAGGISYRAQQLAHAVVLVRAGFSRFLAPGVSETVQNALVESALTNARAMAYFLAPRPKNNDVHFSHYSSTWVTPLSDVHGVIIGVVSEHLSHSTLGSPEGRMHPGEWPLTELAQALLGPMADLVTHLGVVNPDYEVWFRPSPSGPYDMVVDLSWPEVDTVDRNEKVQMLTARLQSHLDRSPSD